MSPTSHPLHHSHASHASHTRITQDPYAAAGVSLGRLVSPTGGLPLASPAALPVLTDATGCVLDFALPIYMVPADALPLALAFF